MDTNKHDFGVMRKVSRKISKITGEERGSAGFSHENPFVFFRVPPVASVETWLN